MQHLGRGSLGGKKWHGFSQRMALTSLFAKGRVYQFHGNRHEIARLGEARLRGLESHVASPCIARAVTAHDKGAAVQYDSTFRSELCLLTRLLHRRP